jgi:hypothetical protein
VIRSPKLLAPLLVFAAALVVYLSTMPRTVMLGDDGEFILASFFNGSPHSPGYPLYTLIGHLASLVPLGTVAARIHGLSGVLAALTCTLLFWIVQRLTHGRASAYAASLCYAFSSVFWSQAIIAEVYTLNTLLFFGLLAIALHLRTTPVSFRQTGSLKNPSTRLLVAFAFVYGLGLSNHWPLIGLSTPCLVVLLWPRIPAVLRSLHLQVPALLLGLTPYLWMYVHSQSDPPISYFGPLTSWQEFFQHVSREVYAGSAWTATWSDRLQSVAFLLLEGLRQFSWLGTGLAALGMLLQRRYLGWPETIALVLAFAANGVGVALVSAGDYSAMHAALLRVFPLIAYGVLAIWIGFGADQLLNWLHRRTVPLAASSWLGWALALVLVATTLFSNLAQNDRRNDRWADRFARLVLESLPNDAILFVAPDPDAFPIAYLNLVEGVRPDVTLMSPFGLVFGNRLFSHVRTTHEERRARNSQFVAASRREIFFIPPLPADIRSRPLCLYRRVLQRSGVAELATDPCARFTSQLDWILDEPALDTWTWLHREDILARALPWLVAEMMRSTDAEERALFRSYIDRSAQTVKTMVILMHELGRHRETFSRKERLALLAEAKELVDERTRKSRHAQLYLEAGRIHMDQNAVSQAVEAYRKSVEIWPNPANPAAGELFEHYRATGNHAAFSALQRRLYRVE